MAQPVFELPHPGLQLVDLIFELLHNKLLVGAPKLYPAQCMARTGGHRDRVVVGIVVARKEMTKVIGQGRGALARVGFACSETNTTDAQGFSKDLAVVPRAAPPFPPARQRHLPAGSNGRHFSTRTRASAGAHGS